MKVTRSKTNEEAVVPLTTTTRTKRLLLSDLLLVAGKRERDSMDLLESMQETFAAPILYRTRSMAREIAFGVDELKYICWQCRAVEKDVKICSGCGVARYCSETCQRAHWKASSHKLKCKQIKRSKKIFDRELEIGDIAVRDGTAIQARWNKYYEA